MRSAIELELSQLNTLFRNMDTSSFPAAHAFPQAVAMFVRLFSGPASAPTRTMSASGRAIMAGASRMDVISAKWATWSTTP
ncbi:MAG: hypothetical protein ACJ789_14940 [Thermomicrobiales bacterium]